MKRITFLYVVETSLSCITWLGIKTLSQVYLFFRISQILSQIFYIHSGILVALAEREILKFTRLDMIINISQFKNIRNGKWFIKVHKNQKVLPSQFCKSERVSIPFAINAIYGPQIKLKTVMGIRTIKYNFSVVALLPKDTWILPQV